MWRYRRIEMLENGNVGLLRCVSVEKRRSLLGICCRETYDDVSLDTLPRLCLRCLRVLLLASLLLGLL